MSHVGTAAAEQNYLLVVFFEVAWWWQENRADCGLLFGKQLPMDGWDPAAGALPKHRNNITWIPFNLS